MARLRSAPPARLASAVHVALASLACLAFAAPLSTAADAGKAYFRLENHGHIAAVRQILPLDDHTLLSASDDKTLRIWDLPAGATADHNLGAADWIRFASEDDGRGAFWCAVANRDHTWVAVGQSGGDADSPTDLLIVDPRGHKIRQHLPGFHGSVSCLSLSADESRLAALDTKGKVSIFDTQSWTAIVEDVTQADKRIRSHGDVCQAIAFSPTEHVLTLGMSSGSIFDVDAAAGYRSATQRQQPREVKAAEAPIRAIAWSSKGQLAAGDSVGRVVLWPGKAAPPQVAAAGISVMCLSFDPAGQYLAAGIDGNSSVDGHAVVWGVGGGAFGAKQEFLDHHLPVTAICFTADGKSVVSGDFAGGIYVWDPATGQDVARLYGAGQRQYELSWTRDSTELVWKRSKRGGFDQAFSLKDMNMEAATQVPPDSAISNQHDDPAKVYLSATGDDDKTQWQIWLDAGLGDKNDTAVISVADRKGILTTPVRGQSFQQCTSAVAGPNRTIIVCAKVDVLAVAAGSAKPVTPRRFRTGLSSAVDIAVSPNKMYLAAICSDQIVRVWSLDGSSPSIEPLFCLYGGSDNQWAVWNPTTGYYRASENGDNVIQFQVNHGDDASLYPSYKCHSIFEDRQKLVDAFVARADISGGDRVNLADAMLKAPEIANVGVTGPGTMPLPGDNTFGTDQSSVVVHVDWTYPGRMDPHEPVTVLVTGGERAVRAEPVPGAQTPPDTGAGPDAAPVLGDQVDRPKRLVVGDNVLTIDVYNRFGFSTRRTIVVRYRPTNDAAPAQGNLYVLSIGVSTYRFADATKMPNLKYPSDDAVDVLGVFNKQAKFYSKVTPKLVKDEEATADRIRTELAAISSLGQTDTLVVFIASHGQGTAAQGYFMDTYDTNPDDPGHTAIPWKEIVDTLAHCRTRNTFLFLDNCKCGASAGFSDVVRQIKDVHGTRILGVAACAAGEDSLESDMLRHGIFTSWLLQALSGTGGSVVPGSDRVSLDDVWHWVSKGVQQDTAMRQHPVPINYDPDDHKGVSLTIPILRLK
jgi:WD40 repeat protein